MVTVLIKRAVVHLDPSGETNHKGSRFLGNFEQETYEDENFRHKCQLYLFGRPSTAQMVTITNCRDF